jgi:hypothetical protein
MSIHRKARLMPQGRPRIVLRIEEADWTLAAAAAATGLSVRRAYR